MKKYEKKYEIALLTQSNQISDGGLSRAPRPGPGPEAQAPITDLIRLGKQCISFFKCDLHILRKLSDFKVSIASAIYKSGCSFVRCGIENFES